MDSENVEDTWNTALSWREVLWFPVTFLCLLLLALGLDDQPPRGNRRRKSVTRRPIAGTRSARYKIEWEGYLLIGVVLIAVAVSICGALWWTRL
jgi:hypothetical protein